MAVAAAVVLAVGGSTFVRYWPPSNTPSRDALSGGGGGPRRVIKVRVWNSTIQSSSLTVVRQDEK